MGGRYGTLPGGSKRALDAGFERARYRSMKKLEQKYLDILEKHDWAVCGYTDDGRVELEKYSPVGEDFTICVNAENLPEAVAETAADFDIDEHIEMWIEARHNGVGGVPSARELVTDAEAIAEMLRELAAALAESEAAE
nr:MAG TPA: hypothetical protein [Caudoviricetes sp.]